MYICVYMSVCVCVYIYIYIIYIYIYIYGSHGCLSYLCHNCGFSCQQRVLKTFPGPGYIHSEDGII